jgi:hypothetical protein
MDELADVGESVDALPQQAFQLAYFIVRDRSLAIRILKRAWNKLNARCKQEGKRAYWRDKYLKRWVTKISRTDCDTLQWLIYFEAEPYERMLEQNGNVTTEDLVIRYVKSLIQMTTGMSSFYVAVGMHRLLHDYSTSEVQRIYETVTERYVGADEYRRAKRSLMNKLSSRFGDFLKTVTLAHGEIRFEPLDDQTPWPELVRKCLRMFVPWSTVGHCLVPAGFGQTSVALPSILSGIADNRLDLDAVEINRCHAFIDPRCCGRLVQGLGFDPPEKKLAVPLFLLGDGQGPNARPGGRLEAANLTQSEIETIQSSLTLEAERRRKARPYALRIVVDGMDHAQLILEQQSEVQVQLDDDARLVEIWTNDQDGDLLIAAYRLRYSSSGRLAAARANIVTGGAKLCLRVNAARASDAGSLTLTNHQFHKTSNTGVTSLKPHFIAYAALALLFIALGWTLGTLKYRQDVRLQRSEPVQFVHQSVPQGEATAAMVKQELTPYDGYTRSANVTHPTIVSLPGTAALLRLSLPLPGPVSGSFRATLRMFPHQTEIMTARLATVDALHTLVTFDVPVTLLLDNNDYIVELQTVTSVRTEQSVHTFIFHVAKTGP